jgi:hypothetical protein
VSTAITRFYVFASCKWSGAKSLCKTNIFSPFIMIQKTAVTQFYSHDSREIHALTGGDSSENTFEMISGKIPDSRWPKLLRTMSLKQGRDTFRALTMA